MRTGLIHFKGFCKGDLQAQLKAWIAYEQAVSKVKVVKTEMNPLNIGFGPISLDVKGGIFIRRHPWKVD